MANLPNLPVVLSSSLSQMSMMFSLPMVESLPRLFEDICEMAFKYNSRDGAPKLLITSRKVGSIINQWAAGRIETTSGEETYGLRLKRYISFHGDLIIIPSRLFEHDYEGVGLILIWRISIIGLLLARIPH